MSRPSAVAVAFGVANRLAKSSHVARLTTAPLDVDDDGPEDTSNSFDENLAAVRRALCEAYRATGARVTPKSDERLLDRLNAIGDGKLGEDLCEVLNHTKEAAYIYGVAIGVLIGQGGVR